MLSAIVAVLSLAAGSYVFATTTVMVIRGWSPVPYWDQWYNLIFSPGQLFSSWLYSQHNEHRIVFPRLLFAIDALVFAETNKFNFFCNIALPLGLVGLVVYIAHRHVSRSIADTLWIAGIALAILFSAVQYQNFIWGFQLQFFGVELAAVASIVCIVLGRSDALGVVAAIAFAMIAAYTLANGILVSLIAIPLAFWVGRPWKQVAALGVAAIALLGFYLQGYARPSGFPDPLNSVLQPSLLVYVAAELGNPFGQLLGHHRHWDTGFGVVGVGLFTIFAFIHLRRGSAVSRSALVFLAVATFVIGTAFLTALGRVNWIPPFESRYASPALLFWLSLTMLAIIELQHGPLALRLPAMALAIPFLLGLAYAQTAFVNGGLAWVLPRREAITALLADVDDRDALKNVFLEPAQWKDGAEKLRAQHLAVFADEWSTWLGTPLSYHVRLGNRAECRGDIEQVTPVSVSGSAQWRINGWAWDNVSGTAPDRIVLADSAGRVVGYALAGYPPKAGGLKGSGWHGHFVGGKTALVTAYALIDRKQTACPLARWPD